MAVMLDRQGQYEAGGEFWAALLDLKEECFGRRDYRTCATLRDYGENLCEQGNFVEGKVMIQEAFRYLKAAKHPEERYAHEAMDDVLKLEQSGGWHENNQKRRCARMSCGKVIICGSCCVRTVLIAYRIDW
jgi:hypothetical protein